ncbi:MAG: preprotein translocase subunit SecA [Clostridiales bacterium]|nr:MAG: preprotein translocase subunit SecA [Clostridiales bacterium]
MGFLDTIWGNTSKREIKKFTPILNKITALEDEYRKLSDTELRGKTQIFKDRIADGETLEDLLPEAFATVREASDRVLGMRHFDCQLIGGIVLHQGRISEMKTGEGKTLVATLPAYLNALNGKGVHVVTVNDYLAKRDSEWMGKIYTFLGLKVGLIVHGISNTERRDAYTADITYGTNNEFGFDYLRDNMVIYKEDMVQRGHAYAIVDEVDSILIDEARTPLIISGHGEESDEMYQRADAFVKRLKPLKLKEMESKENYDDIEEDYIVEEKNKNAVLSAKGVQKAQTAFGVDNLADIENVELQHYINQALRAYGTMQRDVDYVVKDGEVIIVDEFTGRLMFGRRYSNGLHQAIEAKENVTIENESKTLATITFQNLFRLYDKLAGMTGTAMTEQDEFKEIYGLDVVEIPTNKPMVRNDLNDRVFKTEKGKFMAVIRHIKEAYEKGQPVLVGTVTIEKSELLSSLLKREGIPHNVLNAKNHEKEASIIAQAGKKGSVTIATNMAGRGTDIILGGNAEYMSKRQMEKEGFEHEYIVQSTSFVESDNEEVEKARARYKELSTKFKAEVNAEAVEVKEAGGLCIIGTERHESRRIDNQLRGRSGRQGDMGESCFYISLEDDLMRLFGGERISTIANALKMAEDQPIEAKMLSNTIEGAQKKVESQNFERRKRVLQYDDVINQQRKLIYSQRQMVLDGKDLKDYISKMAQDVVSDACARFLSGDDSEHWNLLGLKDEFRFLLKEDELEYSAEELKKIKKGDIEELLQERVNLAYDASEKANTSEKMREIERIILLRNVDKYWMDHIDSMDDLRQGVSLRAYSNRDPVVEYKFESAEMFDEMINSIKQDTVKQVLTVRIVQNREIKRERVAKISAEGTADAMAATAEKRKPIVKTSAQKIGRNDPCPCGSGLKYKKCCGKEGGAE